MMRSKLLLGFLALVLGVGLAAGVQADPIYCYNGHQYFLTDKAYTWQGAENYAKSKGGHLVAINEAVEQEFLKTHFNPYSATERDSEAKQLWIGASDEKVESVWQWSNGEAFSYTNWNTATNEPNNYGGSEDYATIWRFTSGKWNDAMGTHCYKGIVEVAACSAPIPGSALLLGSALLRVMGLRRRQQ